jgi:hypothetical protein
MNARTYVSDKVLCELCTCEGVCHTKLCRDHLNGFTYACLLLTATGHGTLAKMLIHAIAKGADDAVCTEALIAAIGRSLTRSWLRRLIARWL